MLAYVGLKAGAVVSVLLVFGFANYDRGGVWFGVVGAAFSLLLLGEGLLLATDWQDARRTIVTRLAGRRSLSGGLGARLHSGLLGLALQLLGVIWIASGVFLAATAVTTLT